ncbi:MAG: flagellar basal body P-ring protein FlgI [Nitrospiraceae bacterium]|nr:MAG: flagellar basal body P-ring protein FlgI [Nitrospiraceae bacterium]
MMSTLSARKHRGSIMKKVVMANQNYPSKSEDGSSIKITDIVSFIVIMLLFSILTPVHAERIKDIARFEGVRDNQLIGYGIVVGLDGTGDKGTAAVQSITNMLKRLNLTIDPRQLQSKNVALVVVTSSMPAFAKPGMKIDALISTIGDSKSLQGGTLLLTPLKGPDGKVYALAQGPVSIGGFSAEGEGASAQKNHPTVGKIPEGITIEKEPVFILGNGEDIRLFLNRADFATADTISKMINRSFAGDYAFPVDPSSVKITVPDEYRNQIVRLITDIERLNVSIDLPARIVINERTGTIVIGKDVKILPVAIAHGSIAIEIRENSQVSQPAPFAPETAQTVTVPRTDLAVSEQKGSLVEVSGVDLGEIVRALNALGVTPRDLISILQSLKTSGALMAELEII